MPIRLLSPAIIAEVFEKFEGGKEKEMEEILAGILCMLLVLALFPLLLWKRRQTSQFEHEHQDEPQLQQVL